MCRFLQIPIPALAAYAHPERLVTADWLSGNLGRPGLAIVESDEDVLLYDTGHIPGAVKIDWHTDLNDPHVRDYINGEQFADLMNRKGISRDDTVVIYGDKSNWWAAYALWVFTLFGHPDVRLLDGGRDLWISDGRDTTLDVPAKQTSGYPVVERDDAPIRAFKDEVLGILGAAAADRRALPAGVHRRAHPHAGLPRGRRAARRPHPHRALDPVGQGRPGQRPVPQPRGTRGAVRLPDARRQDRRLLPHRRAVQPHLVRADPSARPARGAQLRRVVDRVGQCRAGARRRRGRARRSAMTHASATGRGGVGFPRGGRARTSCSCCWSSPVSCLPLPADLEEAAMEPVPECQSPLFLHVDADDRDQVRLYFSAPPEAPTTRGFASILAQGLDGQSADDILAVPDDFYTDLGLAALISPLRLRGMSAMLARIKRHLR